GSRRGWLTKPCSIGATGPHPGLGPARSARLPPGFSRRRWLACRLAKRPEAGRLLVARLPLGNKQDPSLPIRLRSAVLTFLGGAHARISVRQGPPRNAAVHDAISMIRSP